MLEIMLILLVVMALVIVRERSVIRMVVYLGIFSLFSAVAYLLLGSPDVAMAEAIISAFSTILFIVCIEKYYGRRAYKEGERPLYPNVVAWFKRFLIPFFFCVFLFIAVLYFLPDMEVSTHLRDLYLAQAWIDVGGENVVGAIVLGYRMYDTLFEALILIISVVAVGHLSWYHADAAIDGRHSKIERSSMAIFSIKIVAPLMLVFSVYLILNGHLSAGGGFQGGVAAAAFFICRYMVYNIYDLPIKKVMKLEELVFINMVIVAVLAIFIGAFGQFPARFLPFFQELYLIAMNAMIGLKVACGFFLLFYRYIAIEKLDASDVQS